MFEPRIFIALDTFATKSAPKTNHGDLAVLKVDGDGTTTRNVYLYCGSPSNMKGKFVTSATLRLHLKGGWGGTHNITVKRVTESWKETKLTWNNKPAVDNTNHGTASVVGGADGDALWIDVTAMMQDVANGSPWHGFEVTVDTSGAKLFYSSEDSTWNLRPYLDIDYTAKPDAALDLHPNGHHVYTGTPLLTWTFLSKSPGESQTQSHVQITTAADINFASPTYDSGAQSNTKEQWDLSAPPSGPAFTALTNNTAYIWRVMVYDGHNWSNWSDAADLTYSSGGTLTITSPATNGSSVEDNTPTIDFSFSGRSLSVWYAELYVQEANGTWTELTDDTHGNSYLQEAIATTGDSWSIPEGLIKRIDSGNNYKVIIYGIDTLDRPKSKDMTPSDTRTFLYIKNNTVTAPTGLSLVQSGPGVTATWSRASMPDRWVIDVDGEHKIYLDGVTPFVSGTTYSHTFYRLAPNVAHTISIRAKTDGVGVSDKLGPSSITITIQGVWLARGSTAVQIAGAEVIQETLSQDAQTYFLLGRRDPVMIVGTPRGYNGTVKGTIVSTDGGDSQATKTAALEDLIGQYGFLGDIRLLFGDEAYPVVVSNLQKSRWPKNSDALDVSFDFWQVDDFTVETAI